MTAQPQQAAATEPVPVEGLARLRQWRGFRIRAEHVRDYGILVVFVGMFIFLTF